MFSDEMNTNIVDGVFQNIEMSENKDIFKHTMAVRTNNDNLTPLPRRVVFVIDKSGSMAFCDDNIYGTHTHDIIQNKQTKQSKQKKTDSFSFDFFFFKRKKKN